nr:ribonuclease H-like domain-containing protein [Tanacetum cinerariifolium]
MADAKEMWEAITSRFGGTDESKKMQKYLLKQQFEGFSVSTSEGLHKGYDRFQTLMSQLELHGAGVSHEDVNQKVFKRNVEGTIASSSNTQNVAFVSAENTSSTNDVSTAYSVSSPSVSKSQKEGSSSYTDEVIHYFFSNQSSAPQMDYDDLEQINDDDIEKMDLKWQTKVECFNFHKMGHFARDCKAKGTKIAEEEMLGSDNEVKSCSKACEESYARLKKLYDDQRDKLGDASVEITAYTLALKKASDLEDTPVNDRFADGMHAVPSLITGNYMRSGPDVEIDYSKFTYGPKQTLANESNSKPSEYASYESDSSVETSTSMLELVENASKVFRKPKVWTDAPIIEEYKSDSDNDSVSNVQEDKEKPSFAFTDSVKHDDPHKALKDKGIVDSGCSRHMTGNKAHLADYQEFKGGSVAFGGRNGRITGKFDGKSDSGFLVGYFLNCKAFRVYNLETKRVEENLHVNFLENKPNVAEKGHASMFDLDYLTNSMNYEPVSVENQANKSACPKEANNSAGTQANDDQGANFEEINLNEEHFILPIWSAYSTTVKRSRDKIEKNTGFKTCEKPNASTSSTNLINTVSTPLSTAVPSRAFNDGKLSYPGPSKYALLDDPSMPYLKDIYASPSEGIFTDSSYDDEDVVIDFNNLETTVSVSLTPTTRIHTIHPKTQILKDPKSAVQTRSKINKNFKAHALISQALEDKSWVDAMQEELLQFQIQKGHRQEEGIYYDEVFAHVDRIEAIRIFLYALLDDPSMPHFEDIYASLSEGIFTDSSYDDEDVVTDFNNLETTVRIFTDSSYDDEDVVTNFNNLETTVSVSPTPTTRIYTIHPKTQILKDPKSAVQTRSKVNKNSKAHALISQALEDKNWVDAMQEELLQFQIQKVKQKEDGIFISQDKCVANILKKFNFISLKTTSTPIETQKPLVKDEEAADVDVTPKTSHLHAVKRIFRHYFIKDAYEKKLIQVLKIHTNDDVADLLTKAFDVSSKELASPKQTALEKDISNPLMAGRLPKTILST